MTGDLSSDEAALAFVKEHGVVLESGAGPVPSLAEAVAGEPIQGSWWGHPKGRKIFRATRVVRDSPDVLVCRLIDGKVTYVHRRLWPALVRLADEIGPRHLDAIREQHTASGAHKLTTTSFPAWVPEEIRRSARKLSVADARCHLGAGLSAKARSQPQRKQGPKKGQRKRKNRPGT